MTICVERHDLVSVGCVARRRAAVAHGTLPPHQSRESLAQHRRSTDAPSCPLPRRRPPAPATRRLVCLRDGDPACRPARTARPRPGRRWCRPRCVTASRAASTTARVTRSRPTPPTTVPPTCRMSATPAPPGRPDARRAGRGAGLVVSADGSCVRPPEPARSDGAVSPARRRRPGAAAASRSRARSSQCWHSFASSSPRSHSASDSSSVSPPASSRRTTSASSSRACS